MNFRSQNLLITGGAGFIGSNFIDYIIKKYLDIKIINLDLLTYAGNLSNTKNFNNNPRYKFIQGNICDRDLLTKIFRKYEIDGVINFAAESHVDNSILNPEIFIETNINGVFNLLQIAFKEWFNGPFDIKEKYINSRYHQISTDEVFGSISSESFDENSPYSPNSPYSASKASADMIVRSFNKTFGLNTSVSISSNNYGPNQNDEKFIPKIIKSNLKNTSIPIYGEGNNIRDWIYVKDNCIAIENIFNRAKAGSVYNVGANNEISNLELVKIISEIMKIEPKIEWLDDRFGHDFRYSICSEKIKNDFNIDFNRNFKNTISNYINSICL